MLIRSRHEGLAGSRRRPTSIEYRCVLRRLNVSGPGGLRRPDVATILIGMLRHKLPHTYILLGVVAAVLPISADAGLQQSPPVPAISEGQREFLSRVARRTLRDVVLGREEYAPFYVPRALTDLHAEVVVRLRQDGYLLAAAAAGPKPIAMAIRDAARSAMHVIKLNDGSDLDQVNKMLVEIEVIGQAEPIAAPSDWTKPRAVDPFVEPGIHGLTLTGPRIRSRFCPTELLTGDLVIADALERLAKATHESPAEIADVQLKRFRTVHWYQAGDSADVVSLERGLLLVKPDAVSPEGLDNVISRIAEYMTYRQLDSGLFTYQYEPGSDRYTQENNVVRQVGATAGMAIHAAWSGQPASRAAADLAIRYHLKGFTAVPDDDTAAFIATADGQNKLGVTALLLLALAEHPDAARYESERRKLANGILRLQRPSGMFVTAFPPASEIRSQEYFPGEALLALAVQYGIDPSTKTLESFDRAVVFYKDYFRSTRSPPFVPWQVQAFVLMAGHTKRQDYADYVFELTDWLAGMQLDSSNNPWPEMWGGIAGYGGGRAGVATAAYLEGFADALVFARSVGDKRRVRSYKRVVRQAARFVMQLQVRPEEAYYILSRQDTVGGIRTSPYLNLLRIDHCQHALVGLIKARQALFP